ncbi:MAG TPA: maleylpyruvate isomerase N-terminal domain-containing protein [Candidatus Dormibacteraeota bacterium]|nr:maleylpyruvate isomerase N-terminal domain-containing protein [Candidatus Dormibacteraeota bacterium]
MKIESPSLTLDDLKEFLDTYLDRERTILADRLQEASQRLSALGPRIKSERSDKKEWTAHEVLAHIAVLSKFYGVIVHRVATGQVPGVDIMEAVHLRDAVGHQMSQLEPPDLLRMTLADHDRTIQTLRTTAPDDLRRPAELGDGVTMTAEEIARLPLVSHLELHIEQLEKLLNAR